MLDVAATGAGVVALRVDDFALVGGPDPLLGAWDEVDLGLRLAARTGGRVVVDTRSEVETDDGAGTGAGAGADEDRTAAGRALVRRWPDPPGPRLEEVVARAGFGVAGYRADESPGAHADLRPAEPVLVRAKGMHTLPRRRWSVKIAAPAGPEALRWGDLHFARALAAALERCGQEVVVDHGPAVGRRTAYLDDVSLVLRGRDRVAHQPGAVNILWVISHPELVDSDELAAADAVFAASLRWSEQAAQESGRDVVPLLQATDVAQFNPRVAASTRAEDVLFVGNSRGLYRPVVRHLVEAGVDVAVYGGRWEAFLPAGTVRAEQLPNVELPSMYAAAGVVLNDHWEPMRRGGFMSNRLFDAAAVGARVITDAVDGVEDVLGDLVRTYRTPDELVGLVRGRRDAFPSDDERRGLAEGVVAAHSFDARARVLVEAADALWERREPSRRDHVESRAEEE